MHTTFTIQSVHGLKNTFVVNPNGTVNTAQLQRDDDQESTQQRDSQKNADKPR